MQLRRERERLPVIARGESGDAAAPLRLRQAREGVVRAANLERASALQVLALEVDARADGGVDARRGQHRRAPYDAGEPPRRRLDLVVRQRACHTAGAHDDVAGRNVMRNLGTLLLGIWLVATGLRSAVSLSFAYDTLVLGVLAIAAGVLLIVRR